MPPGDRANVTQGNIATEELAVPISDYVATRLTVNAYIDELLGLLKVLDMVARVYPFVSRKLSCMVHTCNGGFSWAPQTLLESSVSQSSST